MEELGLVPVAGRYIYPICHGSVGLPGQQHLKVWIADHEHRVPATHLSLAYTSSIHAAGLLWQAVPDNFPGKRHEAICKIK
jgi:hypothetical protein